MTLNTTNSQESPMNNSARQLHVDLQGNWHIYQAYELPNMDIIGTVRRGNGEIGALARIKSTGVYVQVNAGIVRTLDQTKAISAIAAAQPDECSGRRRPRSASAIRDWWMDHYDPQADQADYHDKPAEYFQSIIDRVGDLTDDDPDAIEYARAFSNGD